MSDRRAVSAGHLGASSVAAANETWRVAVGGNRVEHMTVDQIAQAFHTGQLNVRTPLWPPGTTGWQALGNFAEFQTNLAAYGSSDYANGSSYDDGGLSQFEEADDDPTRMWTGGTDDLPSLGGMQAPPPPMQQRPSARTGPRQVSRPAPSQAMMAPPPPPPPPVASRPVAVPSQPAGMPTRSMPPPPSLASRTPALVPASVPPYRQSRGNGLMLVAGLVGLVGLGSAVLAARGSWGAASEPAPASTEVAAEGATEPSVSAPVEQRAEAPKAEAPNADSANADSPNAVSPNPEAPKAEASSAAAPKAEGGEAQLAKYEDTSAPASTFVAGEPTKPAANARGMAEGTKADAKRERAEEAAARSALKAEKTARAEKPEKAGKAARSRIDTRSDTRTDTRSEEPGSSKLTAHTTPKRAAAVAELPREKPVPAPAPAPHVEKVEKAEAVAAPQAPANSAVNESAAAALANSANLASSCRPRGGPAGPGKARVIYSNDGEVQSVEILTAKFRDTLTGSCVRMVFRRAKIPAFKGEPPTFIKSFTIPED